MSGSVVKWFRNISITKKLYFVVSIMAILIAVELLMLVFTINTLSSTRAYVGGEGLWSKAEKDAVYSLRKYSSTHNEEDYKAFLQFIRVPMGDRKARLEMEKPEPDPAVVYDGLVEGRNNTNDIQGMVKLFKRFRNVEYINRAITIWAEADNNIPILKDLGNKLHEDIFFNRPGADAERTLEKIDAINEKLTVLEDEFSFTLGEGSRWLEGLILKILFFIALSVEFTGLLLTISVSAGISRGIHDLIQVSAKVAQADFSQRAKIRSNDEIGVLAHSFNKMSDDLERNMDERTRTEEKLILQARQLAEAQQLAHIGSWELDFANFSVKWSDELFRIYGVDKDVFIPTVENFMDFIHPEDRDFVLGTIREYSTSKKTLNYYYRIIRPSGEVRTVNGRGEPILDSKGNFVKAIGTAQDVTEMKQVEDSLKLQTALYENLLRAQSEMGEGVAIMEGEKIVYVNHALCTMFGYSEREILNTPSFINFVVPEEQERLTRRLEEKLAGEEMSDAGEAVVRRKDGKLVNISYSIKITKLGTRNQLVSIIRDITEQKRSEKKIGELASIVEASDDAIISTSPEAIILSWNKGAEKLYGYSSEEMIQKSSSLLALNGNSDEMLNVTQNVLKGEHVIQFETERKRKDGKKIFVSLTASPIRDPLGNITAISTITRDISERKKAEAELHLKSEQLARSNAELEQFAYVASHDLREPLRTVSSYVQLLQNRYSSKLDEQANEFIDFTVDGVKRMDQLINDLLSYSRVSRQDKQLEWMECAEIEEAVITNLHDIIQKNGAHVTFDTMPKIKANKLQMVQLFQNLIANAIKFRSEQTPVIHISAKKQRHKWEFAVSDNGIGIDKKYADKIFVIFQRLHSRKAYEGTGIGLAICKKIVEKHGGNIWFESEPGKGTTFYFTIKES